MNGPPYDGKLCPACPIEIRQLQAVAWKLTHGSRECTMQDLKDASEAAQPIFDAHFADRVHSQGDLSGENK